MDLTFADKPDPVWSAPGGLVLRFTDVTTNVVRMTMDATALAAPQAIKAWWFNLVGVAPSALQFTKLTGTTVASIDRGIDCCKANGTGGSFDFQVNFDTVANRRFLGGTTTMYDLSAPGLNALSFKAKSVPGNFYYSAAHIIAMPNGQSTFVGNVPEPASWILFSTVGIALLVGLRFRPKTH
jgi:hypothetical protein